MRPPSRRLRTSTSLFPWPSASSWCGSSSRGKKGWSPSSPPPAHTRAHTHSRAHAHSRALQRTPPSPQRSRSRLQTFVFGEGLLTPPAGLAFWEPERVWLATDFLSGAGEEPRSVRVAPCPPPGRCSLLPPARAGEQRFVAKPCAIALNIQANGPQIAPPNAILEKVFTAITKHPDEKRLEGLSKQLDWDVRSIQRWFRQRRNQEKPSTLTRFCESMWRFSFYLYVFTYGVRFLKKTPWLWNTRHCWYNYPYQPLTTDLHYYYILELSFYWSLMFSQFTDIKRKDFGIMFLHHLVSIFLITFSYVNNMARVGTLVLCLHDSADALLEAAKMANYAKFQKMCDLLFLMFAMVFITTRLGIFPLWVLNTTLFESWEIVGPYPSWWVFNLLLLLVQGLNCFWSYLIVKIACKAVSRGKVSKDDRSDIESSSDDEDSEPPGKNPHTATTTNGTSGTNGYLLTGSCSMDD
ncbi:ceramide synthase 6 isoform X6 [Callithrix jacchus]